MAALTVPLLVAVASCSSDQPAVSPETPLTTVDATITSSEFERAVCSGTFLRHDLDHTTSPRGEVTAMIDGTGAGVLLHDLDDDGLVDIVLPTISGESSVLWNQGGLKFERAELTTGRFRQAIAVDVDTDGDRDLLLTTGIGPPVAFLNGADSEQPRSFERTEYRTRAVAFSVAPGDLGGDGTVEVITGSYNAELTAARDNRVLQKIDVGVAVTRPTAATLSTGVDTEFLTASAQALALVVTDLNGDGLDDVIVGNDLGTPDQLWLGDPAGLTVARPFDITSLSTMSIDVGDIDGDGDADLVSTDMAPLPSDPEGVWEPVEADIEQARIDDIQKPQNVLQLADGAGTFTEAAAAQGIDATGWSWAGVLGDLDHDGLLDLYVVNGMQGTGIFETLPDGRLEQPNQAFRNVGGGFELTNEWNLAAIEGGRGMAMADLDNDGDLDIAINNLADPSVVFENQLCGGASVIIDPVWSGVQNVDAFGATITVSTPDSSAATMAIAGTRGYLSSGSTAAHFGLGAESPEAVTVTVRWPDGEITVADDVPVGAATRIERAG